MHSRLIIAIVVLTGILLTSGALPAGAASTAVVHVQATIRPWLKFSATQPSSHYRVTDADIRRGYIDLPGAVTVNFQTNIRDDIRVEVVSIGPERVLVHGADASGDEIRIAGTHPAIPEIRVLDLRVILPPGVQKGSYPLQVALAPAAY